MARLMAELTRTSPGADGKPEYIYPWWPVVRLTYALGLRRNETLGVAADCVYTDHFAVEQQRAKWRALYT